MVRLETSGAVLEVAAPDDAASGSTQLHIWEIGGFLAYPVIFGRAVRQLFDGRHNMWRSIRTALWLAISAQFQEIGKRVLRKGGSLSPGQNSSAPRTDSAIRSRRNFAQTDRRPRTIVFTHSLNLDGAPISQFELTVALSRRGDILPFVVASKDGPLRDFYEAENIEVRVHAAEPNATESQSAYERAVSECAGLFDTLSADLVYANSATSFLAIDAADARNLPCIWNLRESDPPEFRFADYTQGVRKRAIECLSLADQVIFVSEASRKTWEPLPADCRVAVIPNALDPDRLRESMSLWSRKTARESLAIAPDEISVICIGTLCERKGQNDIIRAVESLPDDLKQRLHVDMVGDFGDPYGHDIRKAIDALPPRHGGCFRIFSATQDIAQHYQAADIFICSSRVESYPRVILEAMAYGLAIATTPVFGIREQLSDGETALFYAPGDTVLLAQHIRRFADDETVRREFGAHAKASLDQLTTFPEMVRRYAEIFRKTRVGDTIKS